jgi:hypothetical protein
LVLGPGEAKTELDKEIEKSEELFNKITDVGAADEMTEKQLAAKVRNFLFHET